MSMQGMGTNQRDCTPTVDSLMPDPVSAVGKQPEWARAHDHHQRHP